MRYPLLTAVALCLCCQTTPSLGGTNGYHAKGILLTDASGDQFQVQDDTPPTVPDDSPPPEQPLEQGDVVDQANNPDQTDSSDQPQSQDQQDNQGSQDNAHSGAPQSQPPPQESDQNQEDERAIRRMCQEYAEDLPDEEKSQYLQDCIRSQSY